MNFQKVIAAILAITMVASNIFVVPVYAVKTTDFNIFTTVTIEDGSVQSYQTFFENIFGQEFELFDILK